MKLGVYCELFTLKYTTAYAGCVEAWKGKALIRSQVFNGINKVLLVKKSMSVCGNGYYFASIIKQ